MLSNADPKCVGAPVGIEFLAASISWEIIGLNPSIRQKIVYHVIRLSGKSELNSSAFSLHPLKFQHSH